jgi:hypothetical protein
MPIFTPCADAGAASTSAPNATAANNPDFMLIASQHISLKGLVY